MSGAALDSDVPTFKDPYYYALVGVTWICAIGALISFWALTPWFPWR